MHWHDRIEFLMVERGSLTVTCSVNTLTVGAGEFVVVNPKQIHSAACGSEGVDYSVIMFELSPFADNVYFGDKYIKKLLFRQIKIKNVIKDDKIYSLLSDIISAYAECSETAPIEIGGLLLQVLAQLIKSHRIDESNLTSGTADFTEVLDYIDTNYCSNIQIPELADKFGYDKSYFCRKFRRHTGITCVEYIRILRLETSTALLTNTGDSVDRIAEKCGYADANYFFRCFRERYGVSPMEWRKTHKKT